MITECSICSADTSKDLRLFESYILPDGTRLCVAVLHPYYPLSVGRGETVVSLQHTGWRVVDFSTGFKLHNTIESCNNIEEAMEFVVFGSSHQPFHYDYPFKCCVYPSNSKCTMSEPHYGAIVRSFR